MGDSLPIIALTIGDPAGIGPELVLRAMADEGLRSRARLIAVGQRDVFERIAEEQASGNLKLDGFEWGDFDLEQFSLVEPHAEFIPVPKYGAPSAEGGMIAHQSIAAATKMIQRGEADAMVTAPISKESFALAEIPAPGHTELLRDLARVEETWMMLAGGGIRVVLATIHIALAEVPSHITAERLTSLLKMLQKEWPLLAKNPDDKIGVCGLNPHAGEAGLFGREEIDLIAPAVEAARAAGLPIEGPFPADTIFWRALKGDFSLVVAMYHDQGLIPVKTLAFDSGVNITLGLPFVRTSPDHGTAYDIAGKGIAQTASFFAAIDSSIELHTLRAQN